MKNPSLVDTKKSNKKTPASRTPTPSGHSTLHHSFKPVKKAPSMSAKTRSKGTGARWVATKAPVAMQIMDTITVSAALSSPPSTIPLKLARLGAFL